MPNSMERTLTILFFVSLGVSASLFSDLTLPTS